MKILITGGSGFIGSYIIDRLFLKNEIFVIGRNKELQSVTSINGRKVPYIFTDYSTVSLNKVFEIIKPEVVIHMAAQKPLKEKTSVNDYTVNLIVSIALIEMCIKHEVTNIINISSRSVYSIANSIPWREKTIPIPSNQYGLSKLWIDQAAQYYNTKDLKIKTLRIPQVIGLGEKNGFVLQSYLKNACEGNPLKVYGKNIGRRQYIYVKDIASAVESAISQPEIPGIFNIGMAENYSFYELATTINEVFGNKSEIELYENTPADENQYLMSIDKARSELDWEPKFDLLGTYSDIKKDLDILQ